MSARNRELLALIPVALLLTAGFTAVFVDNLDVGNVSLIYGAYFLAICLAIHVLSGSAFPTPTPTCSRSSPC